MALSKTKKIHFSSSYCSGNLAIFLFWPINTDGTLIKPDAKLLKGKAAFLAEKVPNRQYFKKTKYHYYSG